MYQGLETSLAVGGLLLTVGTIIVAITRHLERIKAGAKKQIDETAKKERAEIRATVAALDNRFYADQATQDRNFGEVGASLRQFITDIERKLFRIEIWARDTFATKPELSAVDYRKYMVDLSDVVKDVRHLKRNFEMHQQIYGDLNNEVIRLQKDVERLNKLVNGKH